MNRGADYVMMKLFDKISPNEAVEILRLLAKDDRIIKQKIIEIVDNIIRDVDIDDICEEIFFVLDGIDVHDLWDRSGSTSHGYSSPEDMAYEMLEEELEPFNSEVIRLCELSMQKEAKLYCMGVLKGIYKYAHESKSEFKEWSVDLPGECFNYLLEDWKKRSKDKLEISEMDSFLKKECRKWA